MVPAFKAEDLDLLFEEIKRVLFSKGLLKDSSFREVAIPGTYCQEDHITTPVDLSLLRKEGNPRELFEMATRSKESSIHLQGVISEGSMHDLRHFTDKISAYYRELMVHKFGSFVVQRLIAKYHPAFNQIEEISKMEFKHLILNEYSSRVIQLIVEKSQSFRDFALSFFQHNFDIVLSSSSACHLLVSSLKNSEAIGFGNYILHHLKQQPILLANKFFHRVLLTYLQIALPDQLDDTFRSLGVEYRILKIFNRRATNTVILTLLQREHAYSIETVLVNLARSPQLMFETRYFTFSMYKLSQDKPSSFTRAIFETLVSFSSAVIDDLSKKSVIFYQYLFTVLTCCDEDQRPKVFLFLKRGEVSKPLMKALLKSNGKSNPANDRLLACFNSQ